MRQHSAVRALAKRSYRAVVGPPAIDEVRAWPGTAVNGHGRRLRYLHVGDCNFRRMDYAHDTQAAPGYPRVAAEALAEDGIGVDFAHYFCVRYEHLPEPAALAARIKLPWQPDVVTVHLGASYTRWIVLPDTPRSMQLRVELGRRLGRLTYPGYRLMQPLVSLLGRPASPYEGTQALERFLLQLRETWPTTAVVVVPSFPRLGSNRRQLDLASRVEADLAAAIDRCGVAFLDTATLLGTDPSLRGASGYQLNGKGSEVLGKELAGQILALRARTNRFGRQQATA